MGLIQSIICTTIVCFERALTWTCCACLMMLMMFFVVMLMVYGISLGYHYAHKELASFAVRSRDGSVTTRRPGRSGLEHHPGFRLLDENSTKFKHVTTNPFLEISEHQNPKDQIDFYPHENHPLDLVIPKDSLGASKSLSDVVNPDKLQKEPKLTQLERELARQIISRFRRSRNVKKKLYSTTPISFLTPLRKTITFTTLAVAHT